MWLGRRTVRKRMRAKLLEIKKQLWVRMHAPPGETGKWLRTVVRGLVAHRSLSSCPRH